MDDHADTPRTDSKSWWPDWLVSLSLPRDDLLRIAVVLRATGSDDDEDLAATVEWYAVRETP